MAKIDYKKVEEKLAQALHTMFIKNLLQGHPTVSTQAVSYYRMDDGPRPKKEDSVIQGMKELAEDAQLELLLVKAQEERQPEKEPKQPTIPKIEPIKTATEKIVTTESIPLTITPLFLLQNHLLWFKKKKIKDVYACLNSSEEEITALQKTQSLSETDQKKVADLLKKAEDLKVTIMKKLGIDDDSTFIEKERKKHITKRFNIKASWLPLDTH